MKRVQLKVQVRMQLGKNVGKKLLREGNIPAVVYGDEGESLPIVVNLRQFQRALGTAAGVNSIIELNFGEDSVQDKLTVMVRDLQFEPLSRELIHVDFKQIALDELISAEIPINLTGEAKGIVEGGVAHQQLRSLRVECLPGNLPERIDVDISDLGLGDSFKVEQLSADSDLKILDDPEEVIITILAPTAAPAEDEETETVAEETAAEAPDSEAEEG